MPRIVFTADFDWYPPELNGSWCQAYKAGPEPLRVTRPCADAAIAAGRAVPFEGEADGEDQPAGEPAEEAGGPAAGGAQRGEAGAGARRR
jgi:hypothetical protein